MIPLKDADAIDAMARSGAIIGRLFDALPERVQPGATTGDIDAFVDGFIRDHAGARPAFKGLYGFPASACISVNEEVVHGIPKPDRELKAGDIVSVDVGVELEGWFSDAAVTLPLGEVEAEVERLLDATREALRLGIEQARPGGYVGDIGSAVQRYAEDQGFAVVRDLVGHGIGRQPHEDPQVPNFGRPGQGVRLRPGMVLAIEPMVNAGGPQVRTLADRWTVVTADHRPSAHFEHTVAVTESGPRVLTAAPSAAEGGGQAA